MTPGAGAARVASTPVASTLRGTWSPPGSALRAISCHEVSTGRGASGRGVARKAPAPGRVTTRPSATSTAWALEGMGPWTVVMLRSALAAVLAGGCLLVLRVRVPERRHWAGIAVVAGGVVLGFPLLTTLALQTSTTSHAAVVVGLLPLTT